MDRHGTVKVRLEFHQSKKKERHHAYLNYLLAVKKGLEQKNEIPKRLSL